MGKGNNLYAEECVIKYGKVVGIYKFQYPILFVSDIDIAKRVLVTDFNKFPNHWDIPAAGFPLNGTLLYMKGRRWKDVRAIITPAFTTSKLRQMVEIFSDCCGPLLDNMGKSHAENKPLNTKKNYLGFFIQTIMAIIYGLDVQCQANLDHPFVTKVEKAFQPSMVTLIPIIFPILGPLFEMMGSNIIPKDAVDFFKQIIEDSFQGGVQIRQRREGAAGYVTMNEMYQKNTEFPGDVPTEEDLAKEAAGKPKKLTYNEFLCANVLLLSGGNEATSTFLLCATYQLALSPEVQDKMIEEIDRLAPTPADITYETMSKMTYLEMVIQECFRMYPPTLLADRVCAETVTYGKYTLKKGLLVNIPFYPIQHDEEIWADPEKFDPERFSPQNKDSVHPLGWIVFGAGPRICIAVKFVMLLAKVFMTRVFQKYRFEACPETPIPLTFGKMTMLEPQNVFVRVMPRKDR
ncbi:cytochrome P450 3A9-like [Patiria miniata]|uniref:Thromboxane-A synthase n=1 Tax=Patiria miniata TaxID=46514 RepID=A0A914BA32_PATMI|nr:cytochrome P450 3A9-like [Patiria miniata]